MKRALLLVGAAALLGACGRKDAGTDSANSVNTAPAAATTSPGTGDSMAMSPGAASGATTGAAMPNSTSTGGTTGTGTATDTTRRDTTRRDTSSRRPTRP